MSEGRRYEKLLFSCATDLERNRLVTLTKSTGAVAYSTYGAVPDGWLDTRAENSRAGMIPMHQLYSNMLLKLQTAATKGDPLFAGANGQVCGPTTALAAVVSQNVLTQPTGSEGDVYIVPTTTTGWTLPAQCTAGQIATKGASAWTVADATVGKVAYVADEKKYYICSATNTWVLAKIVAYAAETGIAADEIVCYNARVHPRITSDMRAANENFMIVLMGASEAETDSNAEVVVTDERIASGDIAFVTPQAGTTAANLQINKAVCTANTLTITLAGNGGAGTIINYMIVRAIPA